MQQHGPIVQIEKSWPSAGRSRLVLRKQFPRLDISPAEEVASGCSARPVVADLLMTMSLSGQRSLAQRLVQPGFPGRSA